MAAVFTWTSYVDTDLAFSEFFNSNHTRNAQFYGLLADVGVFARALTPAEIFTAASDHNAAAGEWTGWWRIGS